MFGRRITLFKLFGFEVRLDASWLILAVFVTWSLAMGLFPYYYRGLSNTAYWWMGVAGTIGLFVSIVFHELWHSLVARRFGMPMKGITLFIFGGIAEMEDEPPSAKAEFFMAIVGPISSVVLGFFFYLMILAGRQADWPTPVSGVLGYLAWINIVLAVFNMVPAFPLDGGRVLRSILWGAKGNISWATRVASAVGAGFGWFLIGMGVLNVITGNLLGGVWWVLIGLFLQSAARSSYQQIQLRRALEGEKVAKFMKEDAVVVPPTLPVSHLVEDFIYKYHYKMFPVAEDHHIVGCVSTKEVKEVPREEWDRHTVGEVIKQCSIDNTIHPDEDAMKALAQMNRTGNSRLLVVEGDRLMGVVALKDMLRFLSVKLDLESVEEE